MKELLNRREILYVNSKNDCLKGIDIVHIITRKYHFGKCFYNKEDITTSIEASNEIDKSLKKEIKKTVVEWLGFAEQKPTKSSCAII